MIRTTNRANRRLAPRASIFGKPSPWAPVPSSVLRIEPFTSTVGIAHNVELTGFLLSQPGYVPSATPRVGTAQTVEIGRYSEASRPVRQFRAPTGKSVGPLLKIREPDYEAGERAANRDRELIRRLTASLQPSLSVYLDANGLLVWPSPLFQYQRDGVSTLVACNEVLLADDMGLGKTIQTIAALRILYVRKQIENALIVCPASLVSQWRREIVKWAPDLRTVSIAGSARDRSTLWRVPAHIKLISYDTLRGDVLTLRDSPALRINWSVVVLDEASRIKNAVTGISIACKRLPRSRRWALTGTPLENRINDVASILEFLQNEPNERSSGVSEPAVVRESLRVLQLRRKKEDVLPDLPPKLIVEEYLELLPRQREAYNQAEKEGIVRLKSIGDSITVTHVLELITRLKQICNNDPRSGESAKLADIESRLDTLVAEGHRALIFSQFTDANFGVELAAQRLRAFLPLTYTGAMTASQKDAAIRMFYEDSCHKALVLSLRAGGVGLNLQTASYVFHLDRWWNPAIEDQAESRAHRMGQTFPVTAFRYICSDTIEERIDEKLQAKRLLFKEIVDDVSLDLAAALTEEELFGLFELEAPRSCPKLTPIQDGEPGH